MAEDDLAPAIRAKGRTPVNRTGWQSGIWDGEPDFVEWTDEATGLPCRIVRGRLGQLNGYVGVDASHPWHGLDYGNLPVDVDAHGGLTYADRMKDSEAWWFGFDCAHLYDFVPGLRDSMFGYEVYRDLHYVREQVRNLASQVKAAHA